MKKLMMAGMMAAASCCFGELKIATADLMALVKSHPQHESNRELVKSTASDYRKKMEGMQEQLKSIIDEGKKIQDENASPILSDKAKRDAMKKLEAVQKRLMAQQQAMRSADQRYQEELQELEQRLIRIETEDVRKKLDAYAEKAGYDLILDKNACAFSAKKFDITLDIMKAIGHKPPEKKDEKSAK